MSGAARRCRIGAARWCRIGAVRRCAVGVAHGALAVVAMIFAAAPLTGQETSAGEALYMKWCVECHGETGLGDGPAAATMLPRPRDFQQARYNVRTTGSGELPTDADLQWVLENGLHGTTMPGWPNLSAAERTDVLEYIKSFSAFFADGAPDPIDVGSDPGGGAEAIESGRQAFQTLECFKCHGQAGHGDGSSAPTLEDWRGLPIRAADLAEPWTFNGGGSVEAIRTRMLTGLDGTPMPAYSDAVASEIVTDKEVWDLAHFVASLAPSEEIPRLVEVVRARRVEGDVPATPNDPAWDAVEPLYFPFAGQVVEQPRAFSPTVNGVWVQALHNGEELALRLTWGDPSESPDPAWDEWQIKFAEALEADGTPIPIEPVPDAFAVQFPTEVPDGMERPYFLMGNASDPVYLWMWSSDGGVSEARARGLGQIEALAGGSLEGAAQFDEGQWRLALRRTIAASDEARLGFQQGVAIPMAFFAWDGSSGEDGKRGAVSTWYYVFLEQPPSNIVFVTPVLAVLLTGGLGLVAVRRARSAEGGADADSS